MYTHPRSHTYTHKNAHVHTHKHAYKHTHSPTSPNATPFPLPYPSLPHPHPYPNTPAPVTHARIRPRGSIYRLIQRGCSSERCGSPESGQPAMNIAHELRGVHTRLLCLISLLLRSARPLLWRLSLRCSYLLSSFASLLLRFLSVSPLFLFS